MKFDNSLEKLLNDNELRTYEEFLEHLKINDNDINIDNIKIYRQPLI